MSVQHEAMLLDRGHDSAFSPHDSCFLGLFEHTAAGGLILFLLLCPFSGKVIPGHTRGYEMERAPIIDGYLKHNVGVR
jgi:hypothetical protein